MREKLDKIYSTLVIGEVHNKTKFDLNKVGPAAYGEITQKGVDSLVKKFRGSFDENCIFYDLGSGLGKMVLHIGLKYNVKKSIGIEFSKERHEHAINLKEKYAQKNTNIKFFNESFFNHKPHDATIVYIDNSLHNSKLREEMYDIIPSGCLILCKKPIGKDHTIFEKIEGIERTYEQDWLHWAVK